MVSPVIEAAALRCTYHGSVVPALTGVRFSVAPGECLAVIGPAGAGKTTLAMALLGAVPRFYHGSRRDGLLTVGGIDPATIPASGIGERIGYLHQRPQLHLSGVAGTVFQEIALPLAVRGFSRADIQVRVERSLARLGLGHLADRDPATLSGGEGQRVALASILVTEPEVLILDEPSAQLDPGASSLLAASIRDMRLTSTIVLIDHRLELVAAVATHVLALSGGCQRAFGAAADILSDPALVPEFGAPIWTLLTTDVVRRDTSPRPSIGYRRSVRRMAETLPKSMPENDSSSRRASDHTGSPRLVITDLTFSYPKAAPAVSEFSAHVSAGDRILLVGPNGAGKTTLLKCLNGLLSPTRGQVTAPSLPASRSREHLPRAVGVAFQDPEDQLFCRTAWDEVRVGPRALGHEDVDEASMRALLMVGLAEKRERHPYDLHPVERRLLALASVLAMDTPVVALDEPSAGLGFKERQALLRLLGRLSGAGKALLVVSHDIDLFLPFATRVWLCDKGSLAFDGPAPTFLNDRSVRERLRAAGIGLPVLGRLSRRFDAEALLHRADITRWGVLE